MQGPWRTAAFRWYWGASLTQSVSQGMQFLVLVWLVLEVTGDKTQSGLMLFIYGVPNVGLLMVGGIVADRVDRKLLLMVTQVLVGAMIAGLAVLTIMEIVDLWHIYLSAALLGVLQALNMPARVTMLSDLVDERRLLDAVAQFNAAVHAGRIVGPPLAGVLIDLWGMGAVLALNASCYGVSILLISLVRRPGSRPAPAPQPLLRNIVEGLTVIRDTPVLLTVLVLAISFGGFGMSHLQVIPAFAKDQLGSSATEVGYLLLASGIGSLAGSLSLTFMNRAWLYRWLLALLVVFCATQTLFAWSGWFWATWALFLFMGMFSIGSVWPLATTIMQLSAPAEMRGRVMGVLHFTPGFHYLGAWPLTIAAAEVGWPLAITAAAGLCLLVTFWFGLARKAGRELAAHPAAA